MAHIHSGAPGVAGPIVVNLTGTEDNTVWTVPDGSALDAAGIADFEAGNLYVNVHTMANGPGELRAQLVDGAGMAAEPPAPGSITFSFRNTAVYQPMTPPVVALHNSPDGESGIRLFEVGRPAIAEVIEIAENGNNAPLVAVAEGQIPAGTISAAGVAFVDASEPGPVFPGETATLTLDLESSDQVLSIVSMVICTNDGFTGVDSRTISAEDSDTFLMPVYDAGSETNVLDLTYWVGGPCGGDGENLGDVEGGSIEPHPGQSSDAIGTFGFEAGAEFMEVTITRN